MMKTNTHTNRPNRNQLEPIHSTSLLTASAAVFLKTSKQFLTVAVGAGVVLAMVGLPGTSVQAGVADPWGILNFTTNPYRTGTTPWAVGDKIRYAFVTKGTHNAVSNDIAVYNTWANEQANLVADSKVKDKSTAWKVAAGTAEYTVSPAFVGVKGIDNCAMSVYDGIPVFRLDADTTRMSDSSRGWWFDGLLAACNVDQTGATRNVQAYNGAAMWEPEAPSSGTYGALGNSGSPSPKASEGNVALLDADRWSNSHSPLATLRAFRVVSEVITLVSDAPPAGYTSWAGAGDNAFDADANNDGVDNGMAWVLGAANKEANAYSPTSLLPTLDNTDPTYFIFNYNRLKSSPDTTIKVEYGSDLASWTTAVHNNTTIIITTGTGAGTTDPVQVKISRTLAVGDKLFARLNVVKTP
jgi:hypothetical protein